MTVWCCRVDFSYGDALRTGAIARFSPIMQAVTEHCNMGGFAWGICNGFQICVRQDCCPECCLKTLTSNLHAKRLAEGG